MFPSSLQKNIQELDRQISLLETECENMESGKKDAGTQGRIMSEVAIKNLGNKCFVNGPIFSASLHLTRKMNSSSAPIAYSASYAGFKSSSGKSGNVLEKVENISVKNDEPKEGTLAKSIVCLSDTSRSQKKIHSDGKLVTEKDKKNRNTQNETSGTNFEETSRLTRPSSYSENKDGNFPSKRSISSIKEVSESSEENIVRSRLKSRDKTDKTNRQPWSYIYCQNDSSDRRREKRDTKLNGEITDSTVKGKSFELPTENANLDEVSKCNDENDSFNENKQTSKSGSSDNQILSKKRRSRSARTKKNNSNHVNTDVDVKLIKPAEKEIQCMLWYKERGSNEFMTSLNDSIKTLHELITELKTKSTKENENGTQNLEKISSKPTLTNSLKLLPTGTEENVKFLVEENNIKEFNKTLNGIKQFCEDLCKEKSVLSDELTSKNQIINIMKNKEKEYLSLIASLKYNLEKIKNETEDGFRTKRDLTVTKKKLQEESKIIEALKKSHGKMQALVESYVLENDKLRTQLKIAKLESHKYNVLLAGKEMEIKKYKNEIELFQRQVSEQLRLLKSKANENRIGNTLEALSNQTNIFNRKEPDSYPSETTFDKHNSNEPSSFESIKTSLESDWANISEKEIQKSSFGVFPTEIDKTFEDRGLAENSSRFNHELMKVNPNTKNASFSSCKSDDEKFENNEIKDKSRSDLEAEKTILDSQKIRKSIDEILQEMRNECPEKFWTSSPNSLNTSQCTLISTSSDNISELSSKI